MKSLSIKILTLTALFNASISFDFDTDEFNFTLFNLAQAAGRPDHQNVDCEDEYQDDDIEHVEVIHDRPDDYEYEYDPDDPSEQRPDLGGDEDEDNLGGGGVPPSEPPKDDKEKEERCKNRTNTLNTERAACETEAAEFYRDSLNDICRGKKSVTVSMSVAVNGIVVEGSFSGSVTYDSYEQCRDLVDADKRVLDSACNENYYAGIEAACNT